MTVTPTCPESVIHKRSKGVILLIPCMPSVQDISFSHRISSHTTTLSLSLTHNNLMLCFVGGEGGGCPLRSCLNGWCWWMHVKDTLQVGYGYKLSWEGVREGERDEGGIEGRIVYRRGWGSGGGGCVEVVRMFVFQWAVTLRERGQESGMREERRVRRDGRSKINSECYSIVTDKAGKGEKVSIQNEFVSSRFLYSWLGNNTEFCPAQSCFCFAQFLCPKILP